MNLILSFWESAVTQCLFEVVYELEHSVGISKTIEF